MDVCVVWSKRGRLSFTYHLCDALPAPPSWPPTTTHTHPADTPVLFRQLCLILMAEFVLWLYSVYCLVRIYTQASFCLNAFTLLIITSFCLEERMRYSDLYISFGNAVFLVGWIDIMHIRFYAAAEALILFCLAVTIFLLLKLHVIRSQYVAIVFVAYDLICDVWLNWCLM